MMPSDPVIWLYDNRIIEYAFNDVNESARAFEEDFATSKRSQLVRAANTRHGASPSRRCGYNIGMVWTKEEATWRRFRSRG